MFNDIDYAYTKIFNMMIQNLGEYPRYSPDSRHVDIVTLESGHTIATRNNHTFSGDINPSPSRELLIKISTIGKEPTDLITYPTVVKIGLTIDDVENADTQYFDDSFYDQFMWFDMMPIDRFTYGIYLNDIFGHYMKVGVRNNINFVYRVFDNDGNEYKHTNPHYGDPSANSVWTVHAYKVSLSKYREPNNVDLLIDGYNQYRGLSDIDACRTITSTLNQLTVTSQDTTPLGKFEENVIKDGGTGWTRTDSTHTLSQFEIINIVAELGTYWKENFDCCTVKMYITDPEGTQKTFFLKPSNNAPGKYNFSFRIADLSNRDFFNIDDVNNTVTITFGILPNRHGSYEPETLLPTELELELASTPEEEFSPEDLGVFLSKTANY